MKTSTHSHFVSFRTAPSQQGQIISQIERLQLTVNEQRKKESEVRVSTVQMKCTVRVAVVRARTIYTNELISSTVPRENSTFHIVFLQQVPFDLYLHLRILVCSHSSPFCVRAVH